jgi:hypothetical protein
MEHLLHPAAMHFIKSIAPGFSVTNTEHVITESNKGNDSNDNNNINAADLLGKAIALVKQIHKSPQARSFFCTSCSQVGIAQLELLSWIHTQWGSLFKFLECFILLKVVCLTFLSSKPYLTPYQAITQFILLADTSDDVPCLTKHQSYADYHLSQKDWLCLEDIRDVLRLRSFVFHSFLACVAYLGAVKHPADFLK